MLSKTSKAYEEISAARLALVEGVVVAIDPSIGSTSSMPGWAVYTHGSLRCSGTFDMNPGETIPQRLTKLHHYVRQLYKDWDPDVLVYEQIPALRQGGGNANAHASLLKALGVILSVSGPDHYVGIYPISWKKLVRETYAKGDREDAEEIGWICIEEARKIIQEEGRKKDRKYGQAKQQGSRATSGPKAGQP